MPTQIRLVAGIATVAAGLVGGLADRQRSQTAPAPTPRSAASQMPMVREDVPLPAPVELPQSQESLHVNAPVIFATQLHLIF